MEDMEATDTEIENSEGEFAFESEGEFAFETDHLALRGNKDYSELLKYIIKLEAQKVNALKDIENLADAQTKALEDPISFVEDIKSGKTSFSPHQTIDDLPNIDWSKYGIDPSTIDGDSLTDTKPDKDDRVSIKVRGRKFTDRKPESFNQLWSCEEQKRLEELLEIYPEEPIEAKRYKKIARDLGTRTPIQVMSRVQKYFAKLAKAGLPIPGRAPKGVACDKTKSLFYKKSTFFPELHVPVKMEELDSSEIQEIYSPNEREGSNKYKIELLKAAKEQRLLDDTSPVYQHNTMCVGCQKIGFIGARWTDNAGTDYCTDCIVKFLPSERLMPVRI